LWLGGLSVSTERGEHGGVLRYADGEWEHLLLPVDNLYAITQVPDGRIWMGPPLRNYDGTKWETISQPRELTSWIQDLRTDDQGRLWVATRNYGVFCFDGTNWSHYDIRSGLADNNVNGLLVSADGTIWADTPRGISRFDGRSWMSGALPDAFRSSGYRGALRQSPDGAVWFSEKGRASRYFPDTEAPETRIVLGLQKVSQPGNALISWSGADPWNATLPSALHYSYRLDDGQWSSYTTGQSHVFLAVPSGSHAVEVKARDLDFNEDPTPARFRFDVLPPVWLQGWFGILMLFLVLAMVVSILTAHRAMVRRQERDHALTQRNRALEVASRAKSNFLASMSHELRTPLNSVIGFTELLRTSRAANLEKRQQRNLSTIHRNAIHLLGLIDQLLDLSKIEAGRLEVTPVSFDLKELVEDSLLMVEPLRHGKPVYLRSHIPAALPEVNTDRAKVGQVLLNLLSNAVKFTDEGEVRLSVICSGDRMQLVVTDTGIGIPDEQLETIFEAFSQERHIPHLVEK
jgi:signal transduction histidine kinase